MSLIDELQADMTSAMRSGDALRRDTLRLVIASTQNAAKEKRAPLTDEEAIEVIAREVRKRREAIDAFRAGGRVDLADHEAAEVDILTPYLPTQLSEDEVRTLAREAIAATGATTPRDMGRVMGQLMPRVKGRADGRLVSAVVSEELAAVGPAVEDG
jgi:hypothetical protein